MQLLKASKLVRLARNYPAAALPETTHQSLPTPTFTREGFGVAFLYCQSMVVEPRKGLQLWPPSHTAIISAETGKLLRLATVDSATFNQSHASDKPMGACLTPPERLAEDYLVKLARYYEAYDDVCRSFAAREARVSHEAKIAAAVFQQRLTDVCEPPLAPYYRALSPEFFQWLDAAA
jgi:hypothetical protein